MVLFKTEMLLNTKWHFGPECRKKLLKGLTNKASGAALGRHNCLDLIHAIVKVFDFRVKK